MDNHATILKDALAIGKNLHPDAPEQHHHAFANSVAYAVTRKATIGGYGGPSMREHLAGQIIAKECGNQTCPLEQAVTLLDDCCYGPLTIQHAIMFKTKYCFDDVPSEVETAKKMWEHCTFSAFF